MRSLPSDNSSGLQDDDGSGPIAVTGAIIVIAMVVGGLFLVAG